MGENTASLHYKVKQIDVTSLEGCQLKVKDICWSNGMIDFPLVCNHNKIVMKITNNLNYLCCLLKQFIRPKLVN